MADTPEIPGLGAIMVVFTGLIGVAMVAIIISQKSHTSQVIQALASGTSNVIASAVAPVTGGGSEGGP